MSDPLSSFVYDDTDSLQNEISELYSYAEESEFFSNRNAFEESMEDCGLPLTWKHMVKEQKWRAIDHLMTMLEVSTRSVRIKACRALAYLAQGNFGDCLTLEEQVETSRENVFLLLEHSIFQVFIQQLMIEANLNPLSDQKPETTNSWKNFQESAELRLILSVLCTIVEIMYHAKNSDDPKVQVMRNQFVLDLQGYYDNDLLPVILFQMLNNFCNGTAPHYPVKKICLLLWKVLLVTLGGSDELKNIKSEQRRVARLPPIPDDVVEVAKTMRSTTPPLMPDGMASAHARNFKSSSANVSLANKRRVIKQPAIDPSILPDTKSFYDSQKKSDPEGESDSIEPIPAEPESSLEPAANWYAEVESSFGKHEPTEQERERDSVSSDSGIVDMDQLYMSPRELNFLFKEEPVEIMPKMDLESQEEPSADASAPEDYEWTSGIIDRSDTSPLGPHKFDEFRNEMTSRKGLPWAPKVRKSDLCTHLSNIRQKYLGYTLPTNDLETLFGLPIPIIEGITIMKKHLYISLSEAQLEREEIIDKYPLTRGELNPNYRDSFAEKLYCTLLPRLPQNLIALLKILLAASAPKQNKSTEKVEPLNIMGEVNSGIKDPSIIQTLKMNADSARHREIVIKTTSATILLLLKHYKVNHVYQFEYIAQQLMFANCIPLILKFLNQDIYEYIVNPKSSISPIDFPACVIGEQPELTTETLELCSLQPHCWRNMFSCINLVRILNKLMKWKNSRIMMLVVFKCQQTLMKTLCIRQPLFQLYILKVLKVQLKYLGRQWKKMNMKLVSAIYQKVRHRLTDDWAYSNDNEAKPWDYQAEEYSLQARIHKFHQRRYQHLLASSNQGSHSNGYLPGDRAPRTMMYNPSEKFGGFEEQHQDDFDFNENVRALRVSAHFENNFERWLDSEVFQRQIDWDTLLANEGVV